MYNYSGVSKISVSRLASAGWYLSIQVRLIKPTPIMSRKCVRSLSRNEVSFIPMSDSNEITGELVEAF